MGDLSEHASEGDFESSADDAGFESFLAALAASPAPYRPPTLTPGELFADRYCIDRELGRGGMGTVYLAVDRKLGRKVALKIARGRRADVELARLQHEATIMASLSHPGIVTVFEADADGEDLYLALEFVPGGTLRDWLDVEVRSWREVVKMFATIAQALSAAHAAGVIHRDFKPHNVLIDLHGRPRIADFGLARSQLEPQTLDLPLLSSSGTLTMSGSVVGTPAYMAPEQAEGREVTTASDQFSFFVSLYEALADRRPFVGKTLQAILESIEQGPPSSVPNAPRPLASVIRQGLMADPGERHRDMATVARALERVLHARRRRTRNAVFGLSAFVAMGFGFLSAPEEPEPCRAEELASSVDAIWNETRREQLDAPTRARIGAYRDALVDRRVDTCAGHKVAQTLSDTDFALRSACLDRLEGRLAGVIDDVAQHGPPDALDDLLTTPSSCDDTEELRRLQNAFRGTSLRENGTQDAAYREAERLRIQALLQERRGEDPSAVLDELELLSERHDLVDMLASVYLVRASIELEPANEAVLLDKAQVYANRSRSVDILAQVALKRAVAAIREEDMSQAKVLLDHADTLRQLGLTADRSDAATQVALLRQEVRIAEREIETAVEELRSLKARLEPTSPEAFKVLTLLADAEAERGNLKEASEVYRSALEHPLSKDPGQRFGLLLNRGFILEAADQPQRALPLFDEGSQVLGDPEALPAEYRGYVALGRTRAQRLLGDFSRAQQHAEEARALFEGTDADHTVLPDVLDELSAIAEARGDALSAHSHAMEAIRRYDATRGAGSDAAALSKVRAARALIALGRRTEGAQLARAASETLVAKHRPPDELAVARLALAEATSTEDAEARRMCEGSEFAICREALAREPAATALSP